MKLFHVSLPIALLLLIIDGAQSGPGGSSANSHEKIDRLFAEWDKPDSPGCAIGVIKDGKLIYKRGYGMANLDYNIPLSSESVFYIASTSKQFTAASILLLVRRGVISLEDDIRKYFPELPKYESTITVNHLVHHTSGLRDYLRLWVLGGRKPDEPFDNDMAVELIARQKGVDFKPGEQYSYSNSNYILMAEIVRRASGKNLRDFAEENIFRPLGMTNSHFNDYRERIVKSRVVSYWREPGVPFHQYVTNIEATGDGNLLTTIEDLAKWDQNFYDEKVGGEGFTQQMLTRTKLNNGEEIKYAFGLEVSEYRGLRTVAHRGGFMGFLTEMMRFPEQRFSVICLCNNGESNPSDLAKRIADVYLADRLKPDEAKPRPAPPQSNPPPVITLSADQLKQYVGSYYSEELDSPFHVALENGILLFKIKNNKPWKLTATAKDEFQYRGVIYNFLRNDQGQITGFTLRGRIIKDIRFVKMNTSFP